MSSENNPVRKAWIRHARSLTLRKWLLAALGVALIAWATVTIVHYRRSTETAAVSPAIPAPKTSEKKKSAAAPTPSPPKGASTATPQPAAPPTAAATGTPPAASQGATSSPKATAAPPTGAPAPPPRAAPAGANALILAAPLVPSPAPAVQLPPQAAAPSGSPAPAPASQAVPKLPTVAVASPGFHVVPSDQDTKRLGTVTLSQRNGRTFTIVPAAPAPPPSESNTPPAAVAMAPSRPEGFAPVVANPAVFSGHARATGPLTLEVQGQVIALFGVKPAAPQDRCAAPSGRIESCAALAQAALVHKLAGHSIVACRVPPGQRGTLGAICLDEQGNDLGRFLIIEGLALADSAQSYDYLPAEGAARSAKRGLWRFR